MSRDIFLALADSFLFENRASNPLGQRDTFYGEYIDDIKNLTSEQIESAFIVIEPYEHVGLRPSDNKGVKASENIAWIIHQVTGVKTYIIPAWESGVDSGKSFSLIARNSLGVIFEGGHATVHDPASFPQAFTRDSARDLLVDMMLADSPFLAICLSHQLSAHAHNVLLTRAVDSMLASDHEDFVALGEKIQKVGSLITILKGYGNIATGWEEDTFATASNEDPICENKVLYPYTSNKDEHLPDFVSETHREIAAKFSATIDDLLAETSVRVQSFHSDEVAEEAIQFYCWAYFSIHSLVDRYKTEVASNSTLQFLLSLPIGVEITSSTRDAKEVEVLCEVASTAIYWKDRAAQTVQFHPELDETLMTASEGWRVDWHALKQNNGARLLIALLKSVASRATQV